MSNRSSVLPRLFGGASTRTTKRIIREFAERSDLVYFGYVSQRDDDHHIVRGITVSTKHRDDHYCIGTYEGYDTMFVERTDAVPGGKVHSWHIIEIDLKHSHDLPHVVLRSKKNAHGFEDLLRIKYPTLHAFHMTTDQYAVPSLDKHFTTFISPVDTHAFFQILPAEKAEMIGTHFDGLDIEICNGALYIYSDKQRISGQLLSTMLTNGVWLASLLDQK